MTGPGRHTAPHPSRHPQESEPQTQAVVAEVPPALWGVLGEGFTHTGSLRQGLR